MRLGVIDASVALSWAASEEGVASARLLSSFRDGEVRLIAPSLWEYEVSNVLKRWVAQDRITELEGREALHYLLDLGIELFELRLTAERCWRLALKHQLTIYDAAYLALAEERGCELYTRDKRLAKAARETIPVQPAEEWEV